MRSNKVRNLARTQKALKAQRASNLARGIPSRDLRQIFKSLPAISERQLLSVQMYVKPVVYKKLKQISSFINQDVINDLRKETGALMLMAEEISHDIDCSYLEEDV